MLTHVLHVLSKGLGVAVRSGSTQWCTRTIRGFGFWPNRMHDSDRVRSRGEGGIGHGLVGTRLSWVNHVLFENISWEESRFLNPHKSKTKPKIVKPAMVSRHRTHMSKNFFRPLWRKFYYRPLTNRSFSQISLVLPIGKHVPLVANLNHCLFSPCIFFYGQHGTTGYPCWNLNLFRFVWPFYTLIEFPRHLMSIIQIWTTNTCSNSPKWLEKLYMCPWVHVYVPCQEWEWITTVLAS